MALSAATLESTDTCLTELDDEVAETIQFESFNIGPRLGDSDRIPVDGECTITYFTRLTFLTEVDRTPIDSYASSIHVHLNFDVL